MTNDFNGFGFSEPPVPDAVVTEALAPATASGKVSGKPSGKRGLVIALVIACLAVVALAAFSAYLWSVHSQYVAQNEQLRDEATLLGKRLATSKEITARAQAQLETTNTQLTEAKDSINELADSEAHAGDDKQELIDVAEGLKQCANARQNLIDHLDEAYKWTTSSLRAYEKATTKYCDRVTKAFNEVKDG